MMAYWYSLYLCSGKVLELTTAVAFRFFSAKSTSRK